MCISDWSSDVCSSDLFLGKVVVGHPATVQPLQQPARSAEIGEVPVRRPLVHRRAVEVAAVEDAAVPAEQLRHRVEPLRRSEEHTSELQSLMRISYAVFCLKKNTKITKQRTYTHTQTRMQQQHHIS